MASLAVLPEHFYLHSPCNISKYSPFLPHHQTTINNSTSPRSRINIFFLLSYTPGLVLHHNDLFCGIPLKPTKPSAIPLKPTKQIGISLKPTKQIGGRSGRKSTHLKLECYCALGSSREGWEVMTIGLVKGLWESIRGAFLANPPTWESAIIANATIFLIGSELLRAGLTGAGIAHAFVLGVLTWRAFAGQGLLLVAIFFVLGTAATKVKIKQKEVEGTAEKRKGRRSPASVWGSGFAGAVCALCSVAGYGGSSFFPLWRLAFAASFCTKLSDTVSSEIGKAYGKTTYLISTFQIVPRGTEGAVSLEGTAAGVVAAFLLSGAAYALNQVDGQGAVICVIASQISNLFESYIGALLQDQSGYEWLSNDVVNILNIALGAVLSILIRSLTI